MVSYQDTSTTDQCGKPEDFPYLGTWQSVSSSSHVWLTSCNFPLFQGRLVMPLIKKNVPISSSHTHPPTWPKGSCGGLGLKQA